MITKLIKPYIFLDGTTCLGMMHTRRLKLQSWRNKEYLFPLTGTGQLPGLGKWQQYNFVFVSQLSSSKIRSTQKTFNYSLWLTITFIHIIFLCVGGGRGDFYILPIFLLKHKLLFIFRLSYFHCSLFGYFLGLITATISSEVIYFYSVSGILRDKTTDGKFVYTPNYKKITSSGNYNYTGLYTTIKILKSLLSI